MDHFKELLLLLKTVNIRTVSCPGKSGVFLFDISDENPSTSIPFKNKIKALEVLAITDILSLSQDRIILVLKQLYRLDKVFKDFWRFYYLNNEPYCDEERMKLFLSLNLEESFIVPHIFEQSGKYEIKQEFIDDLYDSILYREKIIQEIITQIEEAVSLSEMNDAKFEKTDSVMPTFCSDQVLSEFISILNPYFSSNHQELLHGLLKNGLSASELLSFSGSGNKLADAFKQLYDANLIVGCSKVELQSWIKNNFVFREKGKSRMFTEKYLSDVVSSNSKQCQSPILDVMRKNGIVELITLNR